MATLDYGAAFLETGVNNVKAHSWDDVLVPFQKVRTLLNTTGIDTANVQANGIRPADLRANTGLLGVRTQVYNDTGSSIAAGSLVYMKDSATVGSETFPKIAKSITTTSMSTTYFAQAIVEADIADNTAGTVSLFSQVSSVNTSAGAVGDPVYLNTSAGGWTLTRPTGGNLVQVVGVIVEDHASTGKINFFLASFPDKNPTDTLSELGDTNITSAADASMLLYDTGTSKWIDNVMSGDATMADTGAVTFAGTNTNLTSLANLVTVGTIGTGTWAATDVAVSHGGTGASSAGSARTNLGLAIGSNVQAYDAGLDSISGLTTAANKMVYTSGSDTYAVADLSVFARTILDDADAGAVRTTIGAQASGSYQTSDAGLTSIAGLTTAADKMIYTSGSDTYVVTALSAFARTILDDADAAAVRSTIGAGSSSASAFADLSDVGSTTATGGRLMVADGDSWESVVVSGDIALASSGAMTIQANSVALATDTTGNYVATVADAGNSHITVANSGAENAAVTLNIADNAVGIAQLAGIARGKIIVGDSSGNPALLAAGSDGNVLQINGSGDAVWGASASSGHTIQEEGSGLTARANLNFVGAGVTATDNGSDTTIVTVTATGSSIPLTRSDGSTSDPIALASAAVGNTLVSDTSPQLGGNLDVNGQSIVSDASNENIPITPHGTGSVVVSKIDVAAGEIDGTAIGANSASTGAFTTLATSSTSTISGDMTFGDNTKVTLGTGGDADIYYDGTDLRVNPKVVGSGGFKVTGAGQMMEVTSTSASSHFVISNTSEAQNNDCSIIFNATKDSTAGSANSTGFIQSYTTNSGGALTGDMRFSTNGGDQTYERMRITSGGRVSINTASAALSMFVVADTGSNFVQRIRCEGSTTSGLYVEWTAHTPDNNSQLFFQGLDATTTRINIYSDGDLANHDGTYGTISDVKFKQDIADVRSYWDDFKSLQYRKFRHKTDVELDADAPYRLGLIAQEVETIFPALVPESPDADIETQGDPILDESGEPVLDEEGNPTYETISTPSGTTHKWVKSSIVEGPIMGSVVQELQTRLEAAEAKITALESA